MESKCCRSRHRQVGGIGRILAAVCFFHCLLFLALALIFTLGLLPGAGHWLSWFDNPILHIVFGGTAMFLASVHLLMHRQSVPIRAFFVTLTGVVLLSLSIGGEFWLHADPHDHAHAEASYYHEHEEHSHGLLDNHNHEGAYQSAVICGCTGGHQSEHVLLHVMFMTGNICLFVVHNMVDSRPLPSL